MNDYSQTVREALNYYDINYFNSYDKMATFKYYKIDIEKNLIYFFDKNKKEMSKYRYELIGKYVPENQVWIWGWSVGVLSKELIKISRKVLNYALDLDKENLELKTELITSRIITTSPYQNELHVALASYLSKQPLIFELYFHEDSQEGQITKINYKIRPISVSYFILTDI